MHPPVGDSNAAKMRIFSVGFSQQVTCKIALVFAVF